MRAQVAAWGSLLLLLLLGCASDPGLAQGPPPDVPDKERVAVSARDGFRVWVDRGCLSGAELDALFRELRGSREQLLARLGRGRAPGDFRSPAEPRGWSPRQPARALPEAIDVVVRRDGDRCHADLYGLTVLAGHLPRHDATHELVHFLAGSSWRPLDEGLAVYLTEELCGPDRGFPVKVRARVFLDLGLDQRLEPRALRDGMSRLDYDTAGAWVRWLIEAQGWERFWELYHGPERAYHQVYGVSELELWRRFWRYVGNLDVGDSSSYRAYRAIVRSRQ
ncbi:MAG: hypothetical protein AB7N76_24920 [Planctomycetota bacterium]